MDKTKDKGRLADKFRKTILVDYMTCTEFILQKTNLDKRGTDWIDNINRYKKLLKKWK